MIDWGTSVTGRLNHPQLPDPYVAPRKRGNFKDPVPSPAPSEAIELNTHEPSAIPTGMAEPNSQEHAPERP